MMVNNPIKLLEKDLSSKMIPSGDNVTNLQTLDIKLNKYNLLLLEDYVDKEEVPPAVYRVLNRVANAIYATVLDNKYTIMNTVEGEQYLLVEINNGNLEVTTSFE